MVVGEQTFSTQAASSICSSIMTDKPIKCLMFVSLFCNCLAEQK